MSDSRGLRGGRRGGVSGTCSGRRGISAPVGEYNAAPHTRRGGVSGSSFGHRSASGSNFGGQSASESSFRDQVDSTHRVLEDIEVPIEEATVQASSINRFQIRVEGEGFYPGGAHRVISMIMKAKYDKPWCHFTEVPDSVKKMWFEEFKKHCQWEGEDEVEIFEVWKSRCAISLRQSLADIRRERSTGKWLSKTVLEALLHRWDTDPEFIEKSQ